MPGSTLELPPARTQPLDPSAWPAALRDRIDEPITFEVLTGSRVDTGHWFHRPRVRALVGSRQLMLWANGRVPFTPRLDCSDLLGSFYNHVTGEVALADRNRKVIRTLKLRPEPGYRLLAQIHHAGSNTSPSDSPGRSRTAETPEPRSALQQA